MAVGSDADDHHSLLNQRDRAMFHLAGRIPLGPHIGDLLEFERTFHRNRKSSAPAQEEEVAHVGPLLGHGANIV